MKGFSIIIGLMLLCAGLLIFFALLHTFTEREYFSEIILLAILLLSFYFGGILIGFNEMRGND